MSKNPLVRRIAATAAAMTLLGAGLVALPAASQAAPIVGSGASPFAVSCSWGKVCFYYGSNGTGAARAYGASDKSMYDERFTLGSTGSNGYGKRVEDNSRSLHNRTGKRVLVFKNRGCFQNNEVGLIIPNGTYVNWADTNKPGYANNIASVKVGSGRCINR